MTAMSATSARPGKDSGHDGPAQPMLSSILDTLGEEIVSGVQPTGHTFTLQDLSQRFDVSRTVAREAMRALEQLGLVSSSRRVGLKVLPLSEWDVFDHLVITWRLKAESQREAQISSLRELRDAIEPQAARLAAIHATEEEGKRLTELAAQIVGKADARQGSTDEFLTADTEFHTLILEASRNEMFRRLAAPIVDMMAGRTLYGMLPEQMHMETMHLHTDLAKAICDGDATAAEEYSRQLLRGVNDFVTM